MPCLSVIDLDHEFFVLARLLCPSGLFFKFVLRLVAHLLCKFISRLYQHVNFERKKHCQPPIGPKVSAMANAFRPWAVFRSLSRFIAAPSLLGSPNKGERASAGMAGRTTVVLDRLQPKATSQSESAHQPLRRLSKLHQRTCAVCCLCDSALITLHS
jgi:hypothetical protein